MIYVIIGAIVVDNDENNNDIENNENNENNNNIENIYEEMLNIIFKYNAHYDNFKQTTNIYTKNDAKSYIHLNYIASSPIPIPYTPFYISNSE